MDGLLEPCIQTARLGMRPLSPEDEDLYCRLYGDPDTMRFIGPPLSRQSALRNFHKVLASLGRRPVERVLLAIVETTPDRCIGIGALQDFEPARRRVEVGMMLVREGRGRGFGTEGLRALVSYSFATFEVDEVWLQHDANSTAAVGPPASLGLLQSADPAKPGKSIWSAYRHKWPADRA
jgi:RimJ/RimL family protein N-acetyltransferase